MIWTEHDDVYQATMSNEHSPFYAKDNKLYIIISWSMGKIMKSDYIVNGFSYRAEGKEIVSYE